MNFAENGFVRKIESVVSTFCGLVWSALRLSASLPQRPQNDSARRRLALGFKAALIASPERETPRIVHSRTRAAALSSSSSSQSFSFRSLPTLSFPSSFSSSLTGDLIGTESGVYMSSDLTTEMGDINVAPAICNYSDRKKLCCTDTRRREYPAPISILARPGNSAGDKSFSLKRRRVDGRLIITKETDQTPKQCRRVTQNGRLLLYLVPPFEDKEYGGEMEDEIDEDDVIEDISDNHIDGRREAEKGPFAMLDSSMPEPNAVNCCFTYLSEGIPVTNFFNMPILNKAIYT